MLLKRSEIDFFSNFHIFYFIYLKITKKMYSKNRKKKDGEQISFMN